MAKKTNYSCILYEAGDKLTEKYNGTEVVEVESTEIRQVGMYPTQFLKFKGKPISVIDISSVYIPAAETVEKYKDGLNRLEMSGSTVKLKRATTAKVSDKAHERLASALKLTRANKNTLTEEDMKPVRRIIPGTPIKIKDEPNET